jgi:hypothetical protein
VSTCLRHHACRHAAAARIKAWPTATHPRYFVVTALGSLGLLALYPLLAADLYALWWLLTQTGGW